MSQTSSWEAWIKHLTQTLEPTCGSTTLLWRSPTKTLTRNEGTMKRDHENEP